MSLIESTIKNGAICATAAWAGNAIKGTISLEKVKDVEIEELPKMAAAFVQSILAKVTPENATHVGNGILEFGKSAYRSFIHLKPEGHFKSIAASLSEHKFALAAGATFGATATVINSLLARVPQLKDQRMARLAASAAISGTAIFVAAQQLPFATDPALVEKIATRVGIVALSTFLVAKIVGTFVRADVKEQKGAAVEQEKVEEKKVDRSQLNSGILDLVQRANARTIKLETRVDDLEKKEAPKPVVVTEKNVNLGLLEATIKQLMQRVINLENKETPKPVVDEKKINALEQRVTDLENKVGALDAAIKIDESSFELGEDAKSTPTNTPQKNNVRQKVNILEETANK